MHMKSNTWVIIQREYLNKVKKKSFLVLTILMPIFFVGIAFAPVLLKDIGHKEKTIAVVDNSGNYHDSFTNSSYGRFLYLRDSSQAIEELNQENIDAIIYIESDAGEDKILNTKLFYKASEPSMELMSFVEDALRRSLQERLLLNLGSIDKETYSEIQKADVNVLVTNISTGERNYPMAKTLIGYVFGFLIYMFVFMFGGQIMSGVIEEKTNRIVEIIISSVKPLELLMGKIVGLALVGLTQLFIWISLSLILFFAVGSVIGLSAGAEALQSSSPLVESMGSGGGMLASNIEMSAVSEFLDIVESINLQKIVLLFIVYFLGGYLLYASLFAAVGAAVENENDTSQFTLPITIPMLLALIVSANILSDPNGSIAFWFSMIPFTSPIAMMIRVPFGVPTWELCLSISLLILGFIATTYISAKIYRVGIFMYGKKPSYKELWKWLRYK